MSSGLETSLDVFFASDGKTPPAFAQSYDRASDFAACCFASTRLTTDFLQSDPNVFDREDSPRHVNAVQF